MKKLWKIVAGLLIFIILAIVVLFLLIDVIVKTGIQKGGTYATGVPVDVQDVKLSLLGGKFTMDNLVISNPEGFTSPHMMKTGKFDLDVVPGSILGNAIEVRKFELDGMDINIDQAGSKNNISVILDHIKQLGGASQSPSSNSGSSANPAPQDTAPAAKPADSVPKGDTGKKIKVNKILIKNVVAHFHLSGPLAKQDLTVSLPTLELDNVSSDDNGATVSQLISRIIPATLTAVLEKGKDIIPGDLLGSLNKDLSSAAGALGANAQKLLGQAASQPVQDIQKNIGKNIGDLLGGKKK